MRNFWKRPDVMQWLLRELGHDLGHTESLHGAGSPQAQRIQIGRQMQLAYKKRLAQILAGIEEKDSLIDEMTGYFTRVFALPPAE